MKKPDVDYRKFRFSKLNNTEFSHLKLLGGWIVYFLLYIITENLIPVENCHVIHIRLDDLIPFCEYFLIPYVFWYFLILISLGYFLLYDVESFKKLQIYIMITQGIGMLFYIFYPNCQNLRPELFERNNVFTQILSLIYAFDTNTGVFPSLHCAYSIGIASVWMRSKDASVLWKIFVVFACLMICLSTMFIKQHSAADFFGAILICIIPEYLLFWRKIKDKKII